MSDESSNQTSTADSTPESGDPADGASGSSGGLEPSGGPRRVVSDQSVDDILNSLDETKTESEDASSPPATDAATSESATDAATSEPTTDDAGTAEPGGDITTEFDEDEVPSADERTDTDADSADAAARNAEPADQDDGDDGSDAETEPSSDDDGAVSNGDNGEAVGAGDDGAPDIDELAARIEDGTVTGADVRAAEAGEGRESTPEVDEIELSMDDIETAQGSSGASSTASGPSTGIADDAGPLAGSIQREGDGDSSDEDGDESPGLFGRIKRFFGG